MEIKTALDEWLALGLIVSAFGAIFVAIAYPAAPRVIYLPMAVFGIVTAVRTIIVDQKRKRRAASDR